MGYYFNTSRNWCPPLKLKVDKAQDLVRAQGRGTIRIIESVGQIF